MSILVIAENDNVSLKASTLNTITAAKAISSDVDVLVCGQGCEMPAKAAAEVAGVRKVYCADCEQLAHRLPEAMAEAVRAALQKDAYTHVFFTSSTAGKAAMPRLAGLLGVSALTDVCGVESADTFKRYIYAGGVLATVKTLANPVIATIRPTAFEAAPAEGGSAVIDFPSAQVKHSRDLAFSYSGLKTAVINYCHNLAQKGLVVPAADVAASFQRAAVEPLVLNTVSLACERGIGTVTAGGGVVANAYLRQRLKEECKKCGLKLVLPQIAFCTDNAAMIAAEGLNKYLAGDFSPLDINAAAHIPLG